MGLLANLVVLDKTGQNLGCFCLVTVTLVLTLNQLLCLGCFKYLDANLLHSFFLLSSRVARLQVSNADL